MKYQSLQNSQKIKIESIYYNWVVNALLSVEEIKLRGHEYT